MAYFLPYTHHVKNKLLLILIVIFPRPLSVFVLTFGNPHACRSITSEQLTLYWIC